MATLLLTRPAERSLAFLQECETRAGRNVPAVISPLFEVEPTDVTPDLNSYQSVVFTSSNGVRCVLDDLAGRRVFTVGDRTAELAKSAGADARALGDDLHAFLENADQITAPALHCRGVHTHGELAAALTDRGIQTDEAVLYGQVARPLSAEALALLAGSEQVIAPVFSQRSASLLAKYDISADLIVIAISELVAQTWEGPGDVRFAEAPTASAMAAAIGAYI